MPSAPTIREDRSWIPVVERGCCCSLEGCCKVQASLVVALSLLYAPTLLIEYLQPQSASIRCQSFDREKGVHRLFQVGEPTLACEWERRGHAGSAKMAEMVVKMLLQAIAFSSALLRPAGLPG
ncbi:uncharacterized protein LOC117641226 [Thrips palmi]|uniref:Uncharacterized protein LOC117641226 n=1 Tax=Thrips palmi TaxID=161013 RepID=A0A6P8YK03_THRPL|nr:uncharacterized protein LOC117641226 [Thrips palmi]